jgi:hypothetical protein
MEKFPLSIALAVGALGAFLLVPAVSSAVTEHDVYPDLNVDLVMISPLGTETIHFTGPAQFDVHFEVDEGDAIDDDGDSRDEVEAAIASLMLTGTSSLGLGTVEITLNPGMASDGLIEELVNNVPGTLDVNPFVASGDADMSFDAFYYVAIGGGDPLFNLDPIRLYAHISHKPGAEAVIEGMFENFFPAPVQLYESGPGAPFPTDFFLAIPEPSSSLLLAAGVAGLGAVRRRKRVARPCRERDLGPPSSV